MFKKFKERLAEVGEEVKKDPRFANSLASVNQLAQQTYSALNKTDHGGSRESLSTQLGLGADAGENGSSGHRRTLSDQYLNANFDFGALDYHKDTDPDKAMSLTNHSFFSLTEDDDQITASPALSPVKEPELPRGASPVSRSRRLSSGSMSSEAANLFPIYEAPQQLFAVPSSDLDSTAGSEWEADDYSSSHLSAVSKEQLFQMLQKNRARYHKYKGRYADVVKAYNEVQNENSKVKNVMQQTQDKALRRISELREQCQLEQSAKRHLEEELRSDIEEKEHIIKTLQTKVALLKSGRSDISPGKSDEVSDNGTLVDLSDSNNSDSVSYKSDTEKVPALEDKVKRLEALLTKCKESIKANKQKTIALTEVKESLATQLAAKEADCQQLTSKLNSSEAELKILRGREQQEELQMAEMKLAMHQEIITKDEEIGSLRTGLKRSVDDVGKLRDEIESLKKARESFEGEKANVISDMSKSQAAIVKAAKDDFERKIEDLQVSHQEQFKEMEEKFANDMKKQVQSLEKEKLRELQLKEGEFSKRLKEKEEEVRLEREELELRVKALTNSEESKSKLLKELETRIQALTSESAKSSQTYETLLSKEKEIAKLLDEKAAIVKEFDDLKGKFDEMMIDFTSLKNESVDLTSMDSKLKLEIVSLKTELAEKSSSDEKLQQKYDLLKEEKEKVELEFSGLQKMVETEQNNNTVELQKNFDAQIDKMKNEHNILHAKFSQDLNEAKIKEENLIKDYTSTIEKLKKDLQDLTETFQDQALQLLERESAISKMREEHQLSLKSAQEQLQTAGNDVTNQLQENFEAQLTSAKDEHRTEQEKLSGELKSLQAKLSKEVSEKGALEVKWQTLDTEHQSARQKLYQIQQDLDSSRNSAKFLETRLKETTEELESKMSLISRLEFDLGTRNNEGQNLMKEIDSLRQYLNEEQKELAALKDRERSQKELEQQMIVYQKDLQEQLRASQLKESHLLKSIEKMESELERNRLELETQAQNKSIEIEQLKNDLDMKMRLEREKENSFKEHQAQSIEYQKRLQEQLEDSVQKLDQSKATVATLQKNHAKEVEQLSLRIECLSSEIETMALEKYELSKKCETLETGQESSQKSLEETTSKLLEIENNRKALEISCDTFRKQFEEKQEEVEKIAKELDQLREDLQTQSSSGLSGIQEKSAELLKLKEQMAAHEIERAKFVNENESLRTTATELQLHVKTLEDKIIELEAEKKKIEGSFLRLSEVEAEYESSMKSITELEGVRQNHEKKIEELNAKITKTQETIKKLKTSRENLQARIEELVSTQSENESKLTCTQSLLDQRNDELETKEKRISELEDVLTDLGHSNESKETTIEELHQRLVESKEQAEELRNELKSIQKEKDAQLVEFEDSLETLEKKVSELRKKNEELTEEKEKLIRRADEAASFVASHKSMKEEQDTRFKSVIKECEKKIQTMEHNHESVVESMRQKAKDDLDTTIRDFRLQISELKQELYEKTTIYDDMVDRHQRELAAKQEELDQEVEACNRMYQARLAEYEAEQEAKWLEIEKPDTNQSSWHWERLQDPRDEIIQRTPTRDHMSKSPPATLNVTVTNSNHHNHVVNSCHHSHSIEEATEYEYLKNILYQYMMGKEPTTLSKVLSAVIKFSPEQTREINIREEHKQSFLATFGFKPL